MAQQKTIIVKSRYNGLRLDQFLKEILRKEELFEGGRENIQKEIVEGKVRVEGRCVRPSYRVKPGETVVLSFSLGETSGKTPSLPEIPILFEDERLIVLNKPAGIAMHPARKGENEGTVASWVGTNYPDLVNIGEDPTRPGLVHRLDKETSGVLVVAKTKASFLALKSLFKERQVKKMYRALVYGHLKTTEGVIEEALGRVKGSLRRGTVGGKRVFGGEIREATTFYRLSTRYPHYDLLEIMPKTGRTHQIRVHLASLGHPVVGDTLYRFKTHRADPLQPPHQLLHAARLTFVLEGKKYVCEAPLPPYFETTLRRLDDAKKKR